MNIPEHVTHEEPSLMEEIDNLEKENGNLQKEISQLESQLTAARQTPNKDTTHPLVPVKATSSQMSNTALKYPINLNRKFYEFTGVTFKHFTEDSVTAWFYPRHDDQSAETARPYRVTFDRNDGSVSGYDLPFLFDMHKAARQYPISRDRDLVAFVDHIRRCCESYFERREQVHELENAVDNKHMKVFPDMQYLLIQIHALAKNSKPEIRFSIWYREDAILPYQHIVRITDAAYIPLWKKLTKDLEVLYQTPLMQAFMGVMQEALPVGSPERESDSEDDSLSEPDWLLSSDNNQDPRTKGKHAQGKTVANKVKPIETESDSNVATIQRSKPHPPPSKKLAKSSKFTKQGSSTKMSNVDERSNFVSASQSRSLEHKKCTDKSRQNMESRKDLDENNKNTKVTTKTKPIQSVPQKSTQTSIANFFKTTEPNTVNSGVGLRSKSSSTIVSIPRKNDIQPIVCQSDFDSHEGKENPSIYSAKTVCVSPNSTKVLVLDNEEDLSLALKQIDMNDNTTIKSQKVFAVLPSINVHSKRKLFTDSSSCDDSTDAGAVPLTSDEDLGRRCRETKGKEVNDTCARKHFAGLPRATLDRSAQSARTNATKEVHTSIADSTRSSETSGDISPTEQPIKDVINSKHSTRLGISPKEVVSRPVMVRTLDVASTQSMVRPKLTIPQELDRDVLRSCSKTDISVTTSKNLNETNNITRQFNNSIRTIQEVDLSLKQLEADLETVLDEPVVAVTSHATQKSFDEVLKEFVEVNVSRRSLIDKAMEWTKENSDDESCVEKSKTSNRSSQMKKTQNKGGDKQFFVSECTEVDNTNLTKNRPTKGRNKQAKISQQNTERSESHLENLIPAKKRPIRGRNQQAKISQRNLACSESSESLVVENHIVPKNDLVRKRNQQAKISQPNAEHSESCECSDVEMPILAKNHTVKGQNQQAKISKQNAKHSESSESSDVEITILVKNQPLPVKGQNQQAKISKQNAKHSESSDSSDVEMPILVKSPPVKGRNQQAKISQQNTKRSAPNEHSDVVDPNPAKKRPIRGQKQQAKISQ